MSAKERIIIGLLFLFLVLMIISESSQKHINWQPSFSVKHKIPFGTYVAHDEARKLWGDQLNDVASSPYVFFQKNPDAKGTYLLYNDLIILGKTNRKALLDWVEKGNNLFIASRSFDWELLDTLKLRTDRYINVDFDKKLNFKLTNPSLPGDTASIDKFHEGYVFVEKDSTGTFTIKTAGKYVDKEQDSLYNFIGFDYGSGKVYLHTLPYVFTNYFILKSDDNAKYFEGILSYLNQKQPLYWDVNMQNGATEAGIFKYIISNPAFLWAYRLFFIGLLLYVLFEGKRKQRAIPVIEPPRNETLVFTKTIADMYITHNEHRQIALMHIKHFMDYVRTQLHIDTRKWDMDMMRKIAQKTKTELKDVKELFQLIDAINQSEKIKPETVMKLEEMIEKIKNT